MWTRKEVKERGKAAFKANYLRSVIVAFILVLVIGSTGAASGNSAREEVNNEYVEKYATGTDENGNKILTSDDIMTIVPFFRG